MNGLLLIVRLLSIIGDEVADQYDNILFWLMIALWVIMPVFIVYEELTSARPSERPKRQAKAKFNFPFF